MAPSSPDGAGQHRRPGGQGERCRRRPRRAARRATGRPVLAARPCSSPRAPPSSCRRPPVGARRWPSRDRPRGVVPYDLQAPPVLVKMPTTPLPRQPVATSGDPVGRMATASMRGHPAAGEGAGEAGGGDEQGPARQARRGGEHPVPGDDGECSTGRGGCRRARPEAAPAPAGRSWGLHVAPPSMLWASGEKWSSWLGRNPTTMDPPAVPATRPPLSATPSGVTTDQCEDPGAAWSSCQNVLFWIREIAHGQHDPGVARRRDGAGQRRSDGRRVSGGGPVPRAAGPRRSERRRTIPNDPSAGSSPGQPGSHECRTSSIRLSRSDENDEAYVWVGPGSSMRASRS